MTIADIPVLKSGSHASITEGACIMEAVTYIAGESWSDHPACACPVLTAFAIKINDRLRDDATRTALLLPYTIRIAGSKASRAVERRRAYAAADWACRTILPLALEVANLGDQAKLMRAIGEVIDEATAIVASDAARKASNAAYAADAADAAYAADAAAAAAYAAAAYAAYAAAYAAYAAYAYAAYAADAYAAYAADARDQFLAEHVPAILNRMLAITEAK
jgi:hypothetical protein